MNRRSVMQRLFGGIILALGKGVLPAEARQAQAPARSSQPPSSRPIQLHCDLAVDPKREAEMLKHFETVFKPTAAKHQGFIDLKMDKLRTNVRGPVPAGGRFRFVLTYQSEELRQKWVDSADHQRVWPPIEAMLTDKNFGILVYDVY